MKEPAPQPQQPKPSKKPALPPKLQMELADKIGEDQIPNFIIYLKEQLNMRPFEFMMQPKKIKNDVMSRAFPYWLESKGLI